MRVGGVMKEAARAELTESIVPLEHFTKAVESLDSQNMLPEMLFLGISKIHIRL